MKYKDLIQFESVDEIIKFDKLNDGDYRDRLVKTSSVPTLSRTSLFHASVGNSTLIPLRKREAYR